MGELVSVRPALFDVHAQHIRVKRTGNDVLIPYVFVRTSLARIGCASARISDANMTRFGSQKSAIFGSPKRLRAREQPTGVTVIDE
jgi:hypothetical protein